MKGVSYIVCAAGEGTRMREISSRIPKPLLILNGRSLLEWSITSLPITENDEVIIVHRFTGNELALLEQFVTKMRQQLKTPIVQLYLEKLTSGQAETAYMARNSVRHSRIAIYNSDTYFRSDALHEAIQTDLFDGIAPCYRTEGDQWSFFETYGAGPFYRAKAVQEKQRISEWCSTGLYYFKNGADFFSLVGSFLKNGRPTGELYVAPLYSMLIQNGEDIRVVDCDEFKPMGTPEQVETFWGQSVAEFKAINNESDCFST